MGALFIAVEIRTVHGLLIHLRKTGRLDVVKAKRLGEDGSKQKLS